MSNINISASIPLDLYNKLEEIVKKEERSKNYFIKKAIRTVIEGYNAINPVINTEQERKEFDKMLKERTIKNKKILDALKERGD